MLSSRNLVGGSAAASISIFAPHSEKFLMEQSGQRMRKGLHLAKGAISMVKQVFCLTMVCFLVVSGGALAQQAAQPAPLGPLGVPVGATGGLNDAPQIFARS